MHSYSGVDLVCFVDSYKHYRAFRKAKSEEPIDFVFGPPIQLSNFFFFHHLVIRFMNAYGLLVEEWGYRFTNNHACHFLSNW